MTKEKQSQERERYWQNHIRQWKQSGISQNQYCNKRKISKNTLNYWIKKQSRKVESRNPGFVQIPVKVLTNVPLEIIIKNGYKIRITGSFDPELLRNIIRILEQLS